MNKTLLAAFAALWLSPLICAAEPESFHVIQARAQSMGETPEGKGYEKRFSEAFVKPMQTALEACIQDTKTPIKVNVVFVIAADGITQRIVTAPDQPVSACAAKKLQNLKVPPPPKPDWMVAVNITIRE